MKQLAATLARLGGVLFVLGWALLLVVGDGSTDNATLLRRTAGLMVYIAVPVLLVAGALAAATGLREAVRSHGRV